MDILVPLDILYHSTRRKASSSLKDEAGGNLLYTFRITHNASVMFRWWLGNICKTFDLWRRQHAITELNNSQHGCTHPCVNLLENTHRLFQHCLDFSKHKLSLGCGVKNEA